MSSVVTRDPYTGLQFVELSHLWGHNSPSMPGSPDVVMYRSVKHAQHGVMATRLRMGMHQGTHMNAPLHLVQRGTGMGDLPLDRFFGNGVVLGIPKQKWELIEPADLEKASPAIQPGDFVIVVTGWHHRYSDSLEYFGDAPGLSKEGAEWLVAKGIKVFAIDTPQVDHPLATSLAGHRGGPLMNRLAKEISGCHGTRSEDRSSRLEYLAQGPAAGGYSRPSSRLAAMLTR